MTEEVMEQAQFEPKFTDEWKKNPMKKPRLKALIINTCVGESGPRYERSKEILRQITNREPVDKPAKQSIRGFNIRKGESIASVVTLRGEEAAKALRRFLYAYDYEVKASSFDQQGNFAFGIREHVDIEDAPFDPMLGTIGFNVVVKIERAGYRIKYRQRKRQSVPRKHLVTPEEAKEYLVTEFGVKII